MLMSQLWRTDNGQRTESEDRAILKQNSQFGLKDHFKTWQSVSDPIRGDSNIPVDSLFLNSWCLICWLTSPLSLESFPTASASSFLSSPVRSWNGNKLYSSPIWFIILYLKEKQDELGGCGFQSLCNINRLTLSYPSKLSWLGWAFAKVSSGHSTSIGDWLSPAQSWEIFLKYFSKLDSRQLDLKAGFPELGSTVAFVAPVEVVHALHGKITVGKAEGRLW